MWQINPKFRIANFLMNKELVIETTRKALVWVDEAIAAMRAAPDDPYGDDEEVIAGAILAELEKKYPRV